METFQAFPTEIFLNIFQLDLEKLRGACLEHIEQEESQTRSGREGSTQHRRFKNKDFEDAVRQMMDYVQVPDRPFKSYKIDAWVNCNPPGALNTSHNHDPFDGIYWSGVFYVDVPSNSGSIVFEDPRQNLVVSNDRKYLHGARKDFSIIPSENLMVMFPSWLYHRVEANNSDLTRTSISFNIYKVRY